MATSGALTGHGAKVEGKKASGTYVEFLGVGDFDMPEDTRGDLDVSSHSSPGVKEYIAAPLRELGTVSFSLDYVPESDTDEFLTSIKATGETITLRFTIPGTTTKEAFSAYLRSYKRSIPFEGVMKSQVEFKIAGTASAS